MEWNSKTYSANYNNFLELLADCCANARINAGISQYKLSKILGISKATISRFEAYQQYSTHTIMAYCTYFREDDIIERTIESYEECYNLPIESIYEE